MTTLSKKSVVLTSRGGHQPAPWVHWKRSNYYHPDLPLFKRGIERWAIDFSFKEQFQDNAQQALIDYGLVQDPHALRIITDFSVANQHPKGSSDVPILAKQYRDFIETKQRHCIEIRDSYPLHPKWSAWRRRMIGATFWRDSAQKHMKLVHAPFTIELTKGCTVGCWFCGVDAEKYQGHLEINGRTEQIWRSMLEGFRDIAGTESAQHGFCYWATDPLDHPEYEWFLEHFHDILGFWPQTTTAQGMKHAERMRRLFRTLKTKNSFIQRFSMTRSTDFNAIHDFFTPEELFLCELIPQFDDRLAQKATAGRVRTLVLKKQRENKPINFKHDLEATGSIACVSGFLGNLMQQSLKLITPCAATDRWPLGYRILDERHFEHPEDIQPLMQEMLDTSLNVHLLPEDQLIPFPGVKFGSENEDKLTISRHGYKKIFSGVSKAESLAEILNNSPITVQDCCGSRQRQGIDPIQTGLTLTRLFQCGIFDEQVIDDHRAICRGNA